MLDASAIDQDIREERGYRTVTVRAELKRLGFSDRQARVPALLIPLYGVHGEIAGYQIRPDTPRVGKNGKTVKYETPGKSRMVLDVPPRVRGRLPDPAVPLFVTEGVKKADAASSQALCCIALIGVWNWRGTNVHGGKTALAEWESIALEGRQIYIVFDSDVTTKPAVRLALLRLKDFLEHRKANVAVVYLSSGPGGVKVGLDDFLAAGHTVDEVILCARPDVQPQEHEPVACGGYVFEDDGIYRLIERLEGTDRVRLTNFVASIECETTIDDGLEERKLYRLTASIGERTVVFDVNAREFEDMRWPTEHIGGGATLFPERNVERHVRAAIQTTSGVTAPRNRVYVHTGWIRLDGACVFLHAEGAIGSDGARDGIEVRLDGALADFALPSQSAAKNRNGAIDAVLSFLDLGPDHITVPLLAAAFRVVIAECDFSVHLAGGSGVFKTTIAALVQQFFGPRLHARNLPGSWSSTANSLEALAFYAKDVLLVVDDFAPSGGAAAVGGLHQSAQRLLRAQGNRSGRGRCAPDGSLRKTRSPRGLILSTGEDTPRGASLRARFLTMEVGPGDIDVSRLSAAQRDAGEGKYARVTSAFIAWLASRLDDVRARLGTRVEELRVWFGRDGRHRRVPGLAADLYFGIENFVEFARGAGGLERADADVLLKRCFEALCDAAAAQEREQQDADPARRFVTLLRSAIASGACHVTDEKGEMPMAPATWGWQVQYVERSAGGDDRSAWRAQGIHVGWIKGEDLYLDAEAALKGAQAVGNTTGDPISVLPTTLAKRLKDSEWLAGTDPDGQHVQVQRRLSGSKRRVLHLHAETVMPTAGGADEDDDSPGDPQDGLIP